MVIANLETPITNLPVSPHVGEKTYIHWTDVELAPKHLKRHNILAVSLANNHTLDYGKEGLRQTLDVLREHGMAGFGAGLDHVEAAKPFLKDVRIGEKHFKLAVLAAHEYSEKYDRRYRHYAREDRPGVNAISKEKLAKQIARLKESDPNTFVVVYPHWNANYAWKTEAQATLCHALIDAGADLIVGHGAHMMQEIEQYRGRWIVYGLGNFMFNSKGRYQKLNAVPLSLVGQLTLRPTSNGLSKTMRLYPIFTDNLVSKYQSRPVTEAEFEQARDLLLNRSPNPEQVKQEVTAGRDDLGRFLEFSLP
jgi:poly-gamma-glutamate capsule biosynthesis protein CapA/YwtB (metallophosphatase superfamily)